ncbi:hypothetical protein KW783_04000 [Candidatus Parcubacteria bacterium]|nr:hypothetical protein [Candidatus Parcubacteria bacterium]
MNRVPYTLIPIIIIAIFALLFIFYVPPGGDLISGTGDLVLGIIVGILLGVCLVADLRRFRMNL